MKARRFGLAIAAAMLLPAMTVAASATTFNTSLIEPPGFYNGTGGVNSGFTVNIVNGIEFGLSAIERGHGPANVPVVGNTYYVPTGSGNAANRAWWNFNYSINLQAAPGNAGLFLDGIQPWLTIKSVEGGSSVTIPALILDSAGWDGIAENLAILSMSTNFGFQNSQNLTFGEYAGLNFDMDNDNTYLIRLWADDLEGNLLGEVNIRVVAGDGAETPLPAALPLFATVLGLGGLVARRRKRKAAAAA